MMNAYTQAGEIPEPFQFPAAALKVLRGHYEVLEHAARFIELSNDTILTEIIDLLPKKLQMTEPGLKVAETYV